MSPIRLGILGSGKGSNFRAILESIEAGRLQASVAIVCSDVPNAGILEIARRNGIATLVIDERRFKTRLSPETEIDLLKRLRDAGVNLVVLAGYMRMLKA